MDKLIRQKLDKVIFLDRDGVINRLMLERGPRETPLRPDDFELLPRAKNALARLKKAGYTLIIVTNQPNIAKGKSTREEYDGIEIRMKEMLGDEAAIDYIYACLHHPDPQQVVVKELLAECECRKPKPGLILQAINDENVNPKKAWLVGDSQTDIQAGLNADLPMNRLIYIGKKYDNRIVTVPDLLAAANIILNLELNPEVL